jgi:hypothetical protein
LRFDRSCWNNATPRQEFHTFAGEQGRVPGVSLASKTNITQVEQELVGGVMKGILLWMVGLPIPIIILLYLFGFM